LSISSMDMKMVMMLRRKRKPATPSANRMALRVRNQDMGTWDIIGGPPVGRTPRSAAAPLVGQNRPGLILMDRKRDVGVPSGPGGPPHLTADYSLVHLLPGQNDGA